MQRKLTAILSADVVGYSGLMERDEAGTLERLKANRSRIFDPQVALHGGRQFKLMGDGALVEFSSVIAAVNCALAIQQDTGRAETADARGEPIRYRIGINLGEVIVDGDDIYGDGVNVAARIQSLAPEGGVALSKMVRDNVEGKMPCVFEDMGEHQVKNIERPVHIYSVRAAPPGEHESREPPEVRKLSICVLPFTNMSGDVEQEYFSDGITEDIITDLSKVSALSVIARNSAFAFKGKSVDVAHVARQLRVSHVLEGSVRKQGGRVRITAQLIDGARNDHIWAERYDRDLNDIFALQDEISQAIVRALKLKLLPQEKKAIETRGTDNPEAYNLFLMARQSFVTGNFGDARNLDAIIRLSGRATEIDPRYAAAWALKARGQMYVRYNFGRAGDGGREAAERALALDPDLAEAHAVMARILFEDGDSVRAGEEIAAAIRLNPESWEVNQQAALLSFRQLRLRDAIRFAEKAAALIETDYGSPGVLSTCYTALGDAAAARRAAQVTFARVEKVLEQDRNNGNALSFGVTALMTLGEIERAREWMSRALLVDPENLNMRYNFACALAAQLKDKDAALDMLAPTLKRMTRGLLHLAKVDPDLDALRDLPRFKEMVAAADARLDADEARRGS
ncbi:MAG TPA: adenylate/guanylate cyclase domain-containing protein [Rhizomicrobium sp.]|nr:adenylate/guanylate cyclase domain-containing protein [Rhizomicrobium sp.]